MPDPGLSRTGSYVLRLAQAACAIGVTAGALMAAHASAKPRIWYVAQAGSDANTGSVSAPFRSISHCAQIARAGDRCQIGSGDYRETVTPNSGVTLDAAAGAVVTIDGRDPQGGWTAFRANIYQSALADIPDLPRNQIFQIDTPLPEARFPNASTDPMGPNWAVMAEGTTQTTIHGEAIPEGDWTGAVLHMFSGTNPFAHQTATVVTVKNNVAITDFANVKTCPYLCAIAGGKYYLVGALVALDSPGEWFFDRKLGRLYLWAPNGREPAGIFVKRREIGIDLRGRSHVTIRNIRLFATTLVMDAKSSFNDIDQLRASYISHHETLPAPDPSALAASDDFNIVASREDSSGIVIDGSHNRLRNAVIAISAGNGVRLRGSYNAVFNNHISKTGYGGSYATAISLSGHDNTISHNTLSQSGRDGITMDVHLTGRRLKSNAIEYNDINNFAMLAPDSGGIYACCSMDASTSRIYRNVIHDAFEVFPAYLPAAVYIDNSSFNFSIRENVLWNCVGFCVYLHGATGPSRGNVVADNIILPGQKFAIRLLRINDAAGTIVSGNAVSGAIMLDDVAPNVTVRENTAAPTIPSWIRSVGCDLKEWRRPTPPATALGAKKQP